MGPIRLRLLVMAGGVVGASVRLAAVVAAGEDRMWLWGVVGLVNLVGCAGVGAAVGAGERWSMPTHWRLAITVGVCGGLTTFSTVAVEVALALDDGVSRAAAATAWAVVSVGLGVLAVVAGRRAVLGGAPDTPGDLAGSP